MNITSETVFIVNPMSNGGRTEKKWKTTLPLIQQFFPESTSLLTSARGDAFSFAQKCLKNENVKKIISVGGDGTNNEIINSFFKDKKILRDDCSFGILPMGTGSDFSRTINMPHQEKLALQILREGKKIWCDIGHVKFLKFGQEEERYFLNAFSFGITGVSAKLIHEKGYKKNKFTYFTKGLESLFQYKPQNIELYSKSEKLFQGPVILVAVTNGRYFAAGMKIAPDANLQNGLLDIILVKNQSKLALLKKFLSLYHGTHIDGDKVKLIRRDEIKATSNEIVFSECDGEESSQLPFEATCLKKVLPLIIPRGLFNPDSQ